MPSSPTTSNRYQKTAAGEHNNTWATDLDTNLDLIDVSLDGWLEVALVANATLTSVNYSTDQSRYRMLHFTGTGAFTVTIPNVSKSYKVKNSCTGIVTLTNGTASVAIQPSEVCDVVTDGSSNFDRVAPAVFNGPVIMGGAVDMASHKINNLTDPTSAQDAATKAYIDAQTLAATLTSFPARPGNKLKGLRVTTDETSVEWAFQGFGGQVAKSGTYSLAATDREKLIRCTGSFTLTLPAVSGFDASFGVYVRNEGTGAVTILGSSATVDGLPTYIMYPGETRLFSNDGANWQSLVLTPFYKTWTVTDAGFVWPPGYQIFEGVGWGGGAAGGAANNSGGGGAGLPYMLPASSVTAGATATITVAASTAGTNTGAATAGGNSSIAALFTFRGAAADGSGGAAATAFAIPIYDGAGGKVSATGVGLGGFYGAGGGGCGANAGGSSVFGGAGGAGVATGAANPGVAPGGGGGGSSGTSGSTHIGGAGARGEVRMGGIV